VAELSKSRSNGKKDRPCGEPYIVLKLVKKGNERGNSIIELTSVTIHKPPAERLD